MTKMESGLARVRACSHEWSKILEPSLMVLQEGKYDAGDETPADDSVADAAG